jgi:hypothetical protein
MTGRSKNTAVDSDKRARCATFIGAQISEALNGAYQQAQPPSGFADSIAARALDRVVTLLKAQPCFAGKTTFEIELLLADARSRTAQDLEPLLAELTDEVAENMLQDVSYALDLRGEVS